MSTDFPKTDPARHITDPKDGTGIFTRAYKDGSPASVDIAELDKASLLLWLRSRGGANEWAENTVCILLGHQP